MWLLKLFKFAHVAHTSLLISFTYVKPAKFTGGFPLSRKFYARTDVNLAGFTYVNEI